MKRRHLVIMLKEPRVGRVKTRLGRDIGMVRAAWWFRHQSAQLIKRLDDPRWNMVLGVSPDSAVHSRTWPGQYPRIAQGPGDLGKRMMRIFKGMPVGPVVIVGGDIPTITSRHIAKAFRSLGRNDAVFGPAEDGGFWLVGLKRLRMENRLFENVRWSTQHTLDDTLIGLSDMRIELIDTLRDVDTADDLSA